MNFIYVFIVSTFTFVNIGSETLKPLLKKLPKTLKESFKPIPYGVDLNENQDVILMMSHAEVTNGQYAMFLNQLESEADKEAFAVQSQNWNDTYTYSEPYKSNYFAHPAYSEYPVVNVSHDSAVAYCEWLTNTNKRIVEGYKIEFRLPSKEEWIYAARGGLENSAYAWGGPACRNKKGCLLANFKLIGDQNISLNPNTGKYEIVETNMTSTSAPAPVVTYHPNAYGLFNMNGNAAEMISANGIAMGGSWLSAGADIRNDSELQYSEPSPSVGFRVLMVLTKTEI